MEEAPRTAKAAWDGNPPEPGSEAERLIQAAKDCIARDGLLATGVASVATQAGVSRPTVYRYFEDREALVNAALVHASMEFAERHAAYTEAFVHPGDMVVESLMFTLDGLLSDPVLGPVFRAQQQLDAFAVRGFTNALSVQAAAHGNEPLARAAGWSEEEAREAIETIMRMMLSLIVSPEPERSPEELRGYLQRRLLPALGLEPGHGERRDGAT